MSGSAVTADMVQTSRLSWRATYLRTLAAAVKLTRLQKLGSFNSAENQGLSKVLSSKPGLGQNVAIYDSSTARNFLLVLISAFVVLSPSYFSKSSPYFNCVSIG